MEMKKVLSVAWSPLLPFLDSPSFSLYLSGTPTPSPLLLLGEGACDPIVVFFTHSPLPSSTIHLLHLYTNDSSFDLFLGSKPPLWALLGILTHAQEPSLSQSSAPKHLPQPSFSWTTLSWPAASAAFLTPRLVTWALYLPPHVCKLSPGFPVYVSTSPHVYPHLSLLYLNLSHLSPGPWQVSQLLCL